jgi:hypothetical protein
MILTPWNDPYFYDTLHGSLPPNYSGGALVVDVETGVLREVNSQGFWEYALGGELDVVESMQEEVISG